MQSGSAFNDQRVSSTVLGVFGRLFVLFSAVGGQAVIVDSAQAQNGTWTQATSGGLWDTSGNWSGNNIADGSGNTANFSTIDITADNTVRLNSPRTIGNLTFGDTATGTAAGWILDNNGSGTNILTLSAATPTITVNALGTGKNALISAEIAGSSGLQKSGSGTLVLSGANTYTGTTTVATGTLEISSNTALGSTTGGTSVTAGADLRLKGGITVTGETLSIAGQGVGSVGALRSSGGNNTWAGTLNVNTSAIARISTDTAGNTFTISGDVITSGTDANGLVLQGAALVAGNGLISGNISGNGKVTRSNSGTGVWTLSGANSHSGGTQVNGNTLRITETTNYGPGNATISNNGLGTGTVTLNGSTAGVSPLLQLRANGQNDATAQTLTYGNALSLIDSLASSTIDVNRESGTGANKTLALGAATMVGTTLNVTGGNGYRLSLSSLNVNSSATVTLNPTTANLTVGAATAVAPNATGQNPILALDGTSGSNSITGIISNGVATTLRVNKSNSSTWTLAGANSFTGSTTVSGGALVLADNLALGSAVGATTVNSGAQVVLQNGITVASEAITIMGSGVNFGGALQADASATATWNGDITLGDNSARVGGQNGGTLNLGGVIKNGAGSTLFIGAPTLAAATVSINGTSNTYTGPTNIVRGTLRIGADNALPVATSLDIGFFDSPDTATFDLNGFNQTVAELKRTGNTTSILTNSAGVTRTFTANQSTTTSYGGNVTGNLSLQKSGSGTLTLAGANTYIGNTTIANGTLALSTAGTNNISSSPVISLATSGASLNVTAVGGGFTLAATQTLAGIGTVQGNVALASGADLSPGLSPGTLTFANNLNLSATGGSNSGDLLFDLGSLSDLVDLTSGTLSIGTGTLGFNDFTFTPVTGFGPGIYTLFQTTQLISGTLDGGNLSGTVGGFGATLAFADGGTNLVLQVVPEPGSIFLSCMAATVLIALHRRSRRQ